MIYQLGQAQGTDPISLILNIFFYVMFILFMLYGTKLQSWRASKEIEVALQELKTWNDEAKGLVIKKIQNYKDKKLTTKDLKVKIDDIMTFISISPTDLDPAGIVPKLDHLINVRDDRFKDEVKVLAPNADSVTTSNLENLLEAAMALDFVYRLIKHYLILGKKSKSYLLLMQVQMQLSLIMAMSKSYLHATRAFKEGSPIGDGLGALVVANLIRDISNRDNIEAIEIAKDTIYQQVDFEGREIFMVRAKGPGGTVGKPGEAIRKLVEKHKNEISRIIMIDAGLKLEGDRTGSIVIGVGAAIGGIGVEKFKIEESTSEVKIPIDAFVCRESLDDAITTMKRPITRSVPKMIEKIKQAIRTRTKEGSKIIIAGIGNTIGIGI
jgi:hypothetical protein